MVPSRFSIQRASASGSLAAFASLTILPCSLMTQIAVFSSDTSSPTNSFIPQSSRWIQYGNGARLPSV